MKKLIIGLSLSFALVAGTFAINNVQEESHGSVSKYGKSELRHGSVS